MKTNTYLGPCFDKAKRKVPLGKGELKKKMGNNPETEVDGGQRNFLRSQFTLGRKLLLAACIPVTYFMGPFRRDFIEDGCRNVTCLIFDMTEKNP